MEDRIIRKFDLQLFADGGDGGSGDGSSQGNSDGNSGGEGDKSAGDKSQNSDKKPDDKTFTQAEMDKIIQDRLKRETKNIKKQVMDDLKKQFSDGGDAGEKSNAEGQVNEEVVKAKQMLEQANQRMVSATATTEAVKLGIDPKYVAGAVKLADLSGVIGEDGSIDEKAVATALTKVVTDYPMFKTATAEAGGFQKVGGQGQQQNQNGWVSQAPKQEAGTSAKRWNRINRG